MTDAVWVLVAAFALQGLWFGLGSALVTARPGLEGGFQAASRILFEFPEAGAGRGLPWLLGVLGGLFWAVRRALDARRDYRARR